MALVTLQFFPVALSRPSLSLPSRTECLPGGLAVQLAQVYRSLKCVALTRTGGVWAWKSHVASQRLINPL